MFHLRGHHIFCLLGYRGMGYSEEYAENMTAVHTALREQPETLVQIIAGPDQLCAKYPEDKEYHCQDKDIYERDAEILSRLGVHIGDILPWSEVENRIRAHVVPEDIGVVCETCSWRSYGYCQQGVERIIGHKGLWNVEHK
ncbi:DUF1284 domain-containing protein [Paenibacillus sediminis]|uniref:DUF1284 domain-containing protein n=1 Tax=Paenibacillus sediminis TaxID=664909 RepID=A0ABS4H523_9BACL|nr:DUF1284 domain-containing protein [Paenibacillus sediminis]MBP1937634.1 hypothetical protein [Paenibacillus sediminis]